MKVFDSLKKEMRANLCQKSSAVRQAIFQDLESTRI